MRARSGQFPGEAGAFGPLAMAQRHCALLRIGDVLRYRNAQKGERAKAGLQAVSSAKREKESSLGLAETLR